MEIDLCISSQITVKASDDASCVAPELAKQAAADNKKDEAAAPSASNSASPSGTTYVPYFRIANAN